MITTVTPTIPLSVLYCSSYLIRLRTCPLMSSIWFNNFFNEPNFSSLYYFYQLFQERTSAALRDSTVLQSKRGLYRTNRLPILRTQPAQILNRPNTSIRNVPSPRSKFVRHSLYSWTAHSLALKKSHTLLGSVPLDTYHGDSTAIYPAYRPKSFVRKTYRKPKKFIVLPTQLSFGKITLFQKYLRSKIVMSRHNPNQPTILQMHNTHARWFRKRRLNRKPAPLFKPYSYLNVELPLRSSEPQPFFFFQEFWTEFGTTKHVSPQTRIRRTNLNAESSLTSKMQEFVYLFRRRFPKRLQKKLRWLRYARLLKISYATSLNPLSLEQRLSANYGCGTSVISIKKLNSLVPSVSSNRVSRLPKGLSRQTTFRPIRTLNKRKKRELRNFATPFNSPNRKRNSKKFLRWIKITEKVYFARTLHSKAVMRPQLGFPRLQFIYKRFFARPYKLRTEVFSIKRTALIRPYFGTLDDEVASKFMSLPILVNKTCLPLLGCSATPLARKHATLPMVRVDLLHKPTDGLYGTATKVQHPHTFFRGPISRVAPLPRKETITQFNFTSAQFFNKLLSTRLRSSSPNSSWLSSSIKLFPTHSFLFRRSDFFFTNLIVRPTPVQLDLLASTPTFSPTFRYHVFPDANLIKVEAFRRLNRQKNFFTTRHHLFNSIKNATARLRGKRQEALTHSSLTANHFPTRLRTSLSEPFRKLGPSFRNTQYISRPTRKVVRVQRVRFKPGYGRIWRAARSSIREIANLPVRYQYRLTPKLHWLYMQDRKLSRLYSPASLDYLMLASHLIPDLWSLNELTHSKSLFLNGSAVQNLNLKVFVNDFIQIVVNLRFYITFKWLKVWSETRQNRVTRIFYSKYRPSGTNRNRRFARPLPSWFFDIKFAYRDIPQNVEVDFFTLSLFVLHDKQPWDQTEPVRANLYDSTSLNMYNWKYIT